MNPQIKTPNYAPEITIQNKQKKVEILLNFEGCNYLLRATKNTGVTVIDLCHICIQKLLFCFDRFLILLPELSLKNQNIRKKPQSFHNFKNHI